MTSVSMTFSGRWQNGGKGRLSESQRPSDSNRRQDLPKGIHLRRGKTIPDIHLRDNTDLNPEVHLHGSAALIVFDVIPADSCQEISPAPTLHDDLERFWFTEMGSPWNCGDGLKLLAGFESALGRLVALNSQMCQNSRHKCFASPYIQGIKEMEREGFSWGLSTSAVERRDAAERLIGASCTLCAMGTRTRETS